MVCELASRARGRLLRALAGYRPPLFSHHKAFSPGFPSRGTPHFSDPDTVPREAAVRDHGGPERLRGGGAVQVRFEGAAVRFLVVSSC